LKNEKKIRDMITHLFVNLSLSVSLSQVGLCDYSRRYQQQQQQQRKKEEEEEGNERKRERDLIIIDHHHSRFLCL